jgi:hypothetical protein
MLCLPFPLVGSRNSSFSGSPRWLLSGFIGVLVPVLTPTTVLGQRLEAVGAALSFNVTQSRATPLVIPMGTYTLHPGTGYARLDNVGHRLTAYGRWQLGESRLFGQAELGYTSSEGQEYRLTHYRLVTPLGPDVEGFQHPLHRVEVAALAGWHTSRRTYVLAGPVLAFNQRETIEVSARYPLTAIYQSLYQSVKPVQVLAQVGIGVLAGRFDFNLRYEQGLTPYTTQFAYEGNTYGYRQQLRQGLFTAGFLLYKRKQV